MLKKAAIGPSTSKSCKKPYQSPGEVNFSDVEQTDVELNLSKGSVTQTTKRKRSTSNRYVKTISCDNAWVLLKPLK